MALAHPRPHGLILMYHQLFPASQADDLDWLVGIGAEQFRRQMDVLVAEARPVPLAELVEGRWDGRPPVPVAVTFDDGYRDVIDYALPVLRDRGIRATVFLTTGFVEGSVLPWWDRLAELVRAENAAGPEQRLARYHELARQCKCQPAEDLDRFLASAFPVPLTSAVGRRFPTWEEIAQAARKGLTFENHTHTHSCVPALSRARLRDDLALANRLIEQHTGRKPRYFAYPGGEIRDISLRSLWLLRREGFTAAFSAGTKAALYWQYCIPRWLHPGIPMLPRKGLRRETTLEEFRSWLRA